MKKSEPVKKIGIIGGGASGIAIGKTLVEAGINDFEILEAENDYGGNWYYGKKSSNVYESTHLISSKLNTQFSDYPMPKEYPAFPKHPQFLAYLQDIARHFGLKKHTTFDVSVMKLEPKEHDWVATLSNGEKKTYQFVIIATGRLHEPLMPTYEGKFTGELLHSKFYTHPDILRHKKVLVIGAGNSGCDIAVDSAHYADKTYLSTRRGYYYFPKFIDGMPYQDWMLSKAKDFASNEEFWAYFKKIIKTAGYDGTDYGLRAPDYEMDQTHPIVNSQVLYYIGHGDILPKPNVKRFQEKKAYFEDGSSVELDLVIFATGYKWSFPFLSDEIIEWQKDGTPNFFMFSAHRKFDNLFFAGTLNTASGFGNIAKTTGRMLLAYLRAQEKDTPAYRVFLKMKQGKNPDLGQERFLKTPRHNCEVDMWKYLKAVALLADKLSS